MMRGLTGVIEMASGNLNIEPWEDLDIEPQGITIHHNDSYDTRTFIPVFTIKMIRYHEKAKEKGGPNKSGREMEQRRHKAQPSQKELTEPTTQLLMSLGEEEE